MPKKSQIYEYSDHGFWIIRTANMLYTRSQNYTNMVDGKHGIQTSEVMVVVLLFLLPFDVCIPTSAHSLLFLDKWCVQVHLMTNQVNDQITPTYLKVQFKFCHSTTLVW
jgi:hypothetical protein